MHAWNEWNIVDLKVISIIMVACVVRMRLVCIWMRRLLECIASTYIKGGGKTYGSINKCLFLPWYRSFPLVDESSLGKPEDVDDRTSEDLDEVSEDSKAHVSDGPTPPVVPLMDDLLGDRVVPPMDDLLVECFCIAIKSKVKKEDLPMLTSTFYRSHMMPLWWETFWHVYANRWLCSCMSCPMFYVTQSLCKSSLHRFISRNQSGTPNATCDNNV